MARDLIERIGLGDHQAVLVRHTEVKGGATPGAGRHHELHVNLNRVGPDGRAAAMSHDYAVVERAVAAIAEEYRMRVVPGRHNGIASDGIFQGGSGAARSFTAATGELTVAARLRADPDTMARLVAARTQGWPSLLQAFEAAGVRVTLSNRTAKAGQSAGVVLVSLADPRRAEKISALDGNGLKWGLPTLEKELGSITPYLGSADVQVEASSSRATQQKRSSSSSLYQAFQAARADALSRRTVISARHRQVMTATQSRHKNARQMLKGTATKRRQAVQIFFGRSSAYGAALNVVFDYKSDERMQALCLAQQQDVAALGKTYQAELALLPIPIWRDWQRGHVAKAVGIESALGTAVVQQPPSDERPKQRDLQEPDEAALQMRRIEEELRRERLRRSRRGRPVLRRSGLFDIPCVGAAACIVSAFVEGRLPLRITIVIVTALSAANLLAPVLLVSAAVHLARHGVMAHSRANLRADADAAKAARSGFRFDAVPAKDRRRYGRLAASDLLTEGGPSAAPILKAMDRSALASFVAWYVHASDAQRDAVRTWARSPNRAPARRARNDDRGR